MKSISSQLHRDAFAGGDPGSPAAKAVEHIRFSGMPKDFIDCGGTVRQTALCQLQLLVATDFDHRLASGKLLKILETSQPILGGGPLPLTMEYGQEIAVVYPVREIEIAGGVLNFALETPRTACLAADKCGLSPEETDTPEEAEAACCPPGSGCC